VAIVRDPVFGVIFANAAPPPGPTREVRSPLGQNGARLSDRNHVAGGGQPAATARNSGPRHRLQSGARSGGADYVRYVPWLPYPKLGVAELEPPKDGKTSWDFSVIDPMTIDFLEGTKGHLVILNFSTIPQWMYKSDRPNAYPADPDQVTWDYEQGTELRDPSCKEVADYHARLIGWYTQGGFTDEFGKRHESGYHHSIVDQDRATGSAGRHAVIAVPRSDPVPAW
jgi:hypothetical protein